MKLCLALLLAFAIFPALAPAATAEAAIRAGLAAQLEAWNRGDIPGFVTTYADDCTFVGKTILQGRDQLLARYKRTYPSPAAMGKLTFSNLTVRSLAAGAAVVTGEWRLDREASGGGPVGGLFSLVWQREHGAWRIVLDHTS